MLGNTVSAPRPVDESFEDVKPAPQEWASEVKDFREKAVASAPAEDDVELSYFAKLAEED